MTAYLSANKTKYDAGGSGDNVISDGYIKSTEKVWMDSFTMATNMSTADTLAIATIPANKKITGVEVYFTAITPTTSTILVGIAGDTDKFIADTATAGVEVLRMDNVDGAQFVTTATTDILLKIGTTAITATTGTGVINTIVRYT